MHKGYKCLHIPTNRIYISRDVIFNEHVFPFANSHPSTASPTEEHILLPTLIPPALPLTNDQYTNMAIPTTVHDVSNPPLVSSGDDFRSPGPFTMTNAAATSGAAHTSSVPDRVLDSIQLTRSAPSNPIHGQATMTLIEPANPVSSSSPAADAPDPTLASTSPALTSPSDHRPRTRIRNNISKIKDFGKEIIRYDPAKRGFLAQVTAPDTSESMPLTYTEALRSPHWRQAMQEEYDALIKNGTWQLVPPQPGSNVVNCKWVFKVKRHADGSVERYKVTKGFNHRYDLDYDETFSLVIKPTKVRLILSIAISKGWCIHQADVKNALLDGDL
jgi:hypothetical protein